MRPSFSSNGQLVDYLVDQERIRSDRVADKTPSTQIKEDNRSGCNYLSIEGKGCLPLAREIEDHLKAKKDQCKKLIQWCESRLERENQNRKYTEKELSIHEEIQNLNSGQ
jgi:hypothetical protein